MSVRWSWVCGALLALGVGGPVWAQEEEDEFDTSYFGARVGVWYRPAFDMTMTVNGQGLGGVGTVLGSQIDARDDLSVRGNPTSDYMVRQGILEGAIVLDTRWLSVEAWGIAPFVYEGRATLQRTINFGGTTFTAGVPVDSKFEQWMGAIDLKANILNNGIVRVSPVLGLRVLAIDWEIRAFDGSFVGDTSDLSTPLSRGDDQLLPYPEVGAELRVGWRSLIEGDLQITGMALTAKDYKVLTYKIDAGVTVYPIEWVGVRLGGRVWRLDFESPDSRDDDDDGYALDAVYMGLNLSVILRFG